MNTNLTNNNSILIVGSKEKSSLDDIYFRTFQNLGYKIEFFNIQKSLNHRIIAGKESVGFLVKVKELVEDPSELVLGI